MMDSEARRGMSGPNGKGRKKGRHELALQSKSCMHSTSVRSVGPGGDNLGVCGNTQKEEANEGQRAEADLGCLARYRQHLRGCASVNDCQSDFELVLKCLGGGFSTMCSASDSLFC